MHAVSAFKAKNKLAALLDRVEQGEEVLITRHGKAVRGWCRLPRNSIVTMLARQLIT